MPALGSDLARPGGALAALLALALLAACGGAPDAPAPQAGADDDDSADLLSAVLVEKSRLIIEAGDAQGLYRDEPGGLRRLVHAAYGVPGDLGRWSPPPEATAQAPWEAIPLPSTPLDIAVAGDGSLAIATEDALAVLRPGAQELAEAEGLPGGRLQWNHDGSRLAVSGSRAKRVVSWPGLDVLVELPPQSRGILLFGPGEDEELWLVRDEVDFNAASPLRVAWTVERFDGEGFERVRPQPGALFDAGAIGTLPPLGRAWGQPAQPFQLLPDPGPIHFLDAIFALDAPITALDRGIDLFPSGASTGEVAFVRSPRAPRAGLGRGARAWIAATHAGPEAARPVTAEPTFRAALSPDGQWAAFLVARDGRPVALRAPRRDWDQPAIRAAQAARQGMLARAMLVRLEVESAFAATGLPGSMRDGPFGPLLGRAVEEAEVDALAAALRRGLREHFGIDLAASGIGALDDLLAELDGAWGEEPPMILAIAGLHASLLPKWMEARWVAPLADPELAAGAPESTAVNERHGLYTLHNPLFAAREALSGAMRLDEEVRALARQARPPVALVDGLTPENEAALLDALLRGYGLEPAEVDLAALATAHDAAPREAMLALFLWSEAARLGDQAMADLAALAIAEARPLNEWALIRAARAIEAYGELDAAADLYARAAEIAPADPETLAAAADGLLFCGRPEEAAPLVDRILRRTRPHPVDGRPVPVDDWHADEARRIQSDIERRGREAAPQ